MKSKLPLLIPCLLLLTSLSFFSCERTSAGDDGTNNTNLCARLNTVRIHPYVAVTKGEQIKLTVDSLTDAQYFWSGPGNYQSYYQDNIITDYAEYYHRGWYYVRVYRDGCDPHFDSVYVNVKFPQGTPSCTPANNTADFSGGVLLGDQSFSFVSFGNVLGDYEITGNSSNGDINYKFSAYWLTHDLEDGIYYTTSTPSIDYADIDRIYINNVNQSIFWVAEPNKPVYVSHVGGKQCVTFCGIDFSGTWGSSLYHTTVSAKITQP